MNGPKHREKGQNQPEIFVDNLQEIPAFFAFSPLAGARTFMV